MFLLLRLLSVKGTSGTGAIREEPTRAGVFVGADVEDPWRTSRYREAFFDPLPSVQQEDHCPVGDLGEDCPLHSSKDLLLSQQ